MGAGDSSGPKTLDFLTYPLSSTPWMLRSVFVKGFLVPPLVDFFFPQLWMVALDCGFMFKKYISNKIIWADTHYEKTESNIPHLC